MMSKPTAREKKLLRKLVATIKQLKSALDDCPSAKGEFGGSLLYGKIKAIAFDVETELRKEGVSISKLY